MLKKLMIVSFSLLAIIFAINIIISFDSKENINYKDKYLEAEEKIDELNEEIHDSLMNAGSIEVENDELNSMIVDYQELSYNLMNSYDEELDSALNVLRKTKETGEIEDYEKYVEACIKIEEYISEAYDISIDLDNVYVNNAH